MLARLLYLIYSGELISGLINAPSFLNDCELTSFMYLILGSPLHSCLSLTSWLGLLGIRGRSVDGRHIMNGRRLPSIGDPRGPR